jgi:hypothetical protein
MRVATLAGNDLKSTQASPHAKKPRGIGRQSFDKSYVLGYADGEAAAKSERKASSRDVPE